ALVRARPLARPGRGPARLHVHAAAPRSPATRLARPHGPPRAALAAGPAGAHPHRIGRTGGGAGRAPRARAAAQSAGPHPGHRAARRPRLPRPDARGAGARAAARPAARAHPDRARPLRRPAPALRARGRRGRALRGHGRAQARAARIRRARASGSRPGVPARTLRRAAARDPGGGGGALRRPAEARPRGTPVRARGTRERDRRRGRQSPRRAGSGRADRSRPPGTRPGAQVRTTPRRRAGPPFGAMSESLAPLPERPLPGSTAPPGDGPPPAVRVLVVDAEPSVVDVFRDFLGAQGYVLSAASSAEEALKVIPGLRPDIIVTDIKLPRLAGDERMRFAKHVDP